jgi:hypothetical protein
MNQRQWIESSFPRFDPVTKDNVDTLFKRAGFNALVHVIDVQAVNLGDKGVWYRCKLCDVQAPTRIVSDAKAWSYVGLHATTNAGIIGILMEKRVKRMSFAGVYCMMVQNAVNVEDLKPCAAKVMGGKRDFTGVVCEIKAHGVSEPISRGGIEADEEICRRGHISHMKTRSEDRWLVPEDLVELKAFWFGPNCLANIKSTDVIVL